MHRHTKGSLGEALAEASSIFREATLPNPRLDAELLLLSLLHIDRARLLTSLETPLAAEQREAFHDLCRRRAQGEPLQYLAGEWDFWRDTFEVGPGTLIPRPETELLVELGAPLARKTGGATPFLLDLATGTGCVALSLLRELPGSLAVATDLSPEAVNRTARNAFRLGLSGRLRILRADGSSAFGERARGTFHLVVSNPPYIPLEEYATMDPVVRLHEPRMALVGGEDGLDFYRAWIPAVLPLLAPGGHILMEFGFGQRDALASLLATTGLPLVFHPDLAGIPRVFQLGPTP